MLVNEKQCFLLLLSFSLHFFPFLSSNTYGEPEIATTQVRNDDATVRRLL